MPYVRPPVLNTSTSLAPLMEPNPPEPSNIVDTGAGRVGSVTSIICTPLSEKAATMPYTRPSM